MRACADDRYLISLRLAAAGYTALCPASVSLQSTRSHFNYDGERCVSLRSRRHCLASRANWFFSRVSAVPAFDTPLWPLSSATVQTGRCVIVVTQPPSPLRASSRTRVTIYLYANLRAVRDNTFVDQRRLELYSSLCSFVWPIMPLTVLRLLFFLFFFQSGKSNRTPGDAKCVTVFFGEGKNKEVRGGTK